jgi:hypothetical protein
MMALLETSACPDLSEHAIKLVCLLINAECDAIASIHGDEPLCHSCIFEENAISIERLPAGAFIIVLKHLIERNSEFLPYSFQALSHCCGQVLQTLLSKGFPWRRIREQNCERPGSLPSLPLLTELT